MIFALNVARKEEIVWFVIGFKCPTIDAITQAAKYRLEARYSIGCRGEVGVDRIQAVEAKWATMRATSSKES